MYSHTMAELIRISERCDHLNGIGLAVEHFPGYIQTRTLPHHHDAVEFAYIRAGSGRHRLGRSAHPTEAGWLGIVHHTQEHEFRTAPTGIDVVNLYLDLRRCPLPDLDSELGRDLARLLPQHPSLRHRRNHFVSMHFADDSADRPLMAMLAEQTAKRRGWQDAMRAWFRLLLVAIARQAHAGGCVPPPGNAGVGDERMEEIAATLEERMAEPCDLDQLAALAGMAKPSLCRAFKRFTGTTIGGYRMRLRIDAALRRLREDDANITDIALGVGYEDVSLFNRHFRRLVGTTPGAWRSASG